MNDSCFYFVKSKYVVRPTQERGRKEGWEGEREKAKSKRERERYHWDFAQKRRLVAPCYSAVFQRKAEQVVSC